MGFGKTYQYWLNKLSEQPAGHAEEHDLDTVWAGIEEELILDEAWTGIDALLEPALTTPGTGSKTRSSIFHRPGLTIFLGSILVFVLLLWRSDVFIPGQDDPPPNIPEINSPEQELLLNPARRIHSKTEPLKTETVESVEKNDNSAMSRLAAGTNYIEEKTEMIPRKPLPSIAPAVQEENTREIAEETKSWERKSLKAGSGKGWDIPHPSLHVALPAIEVAHQNHYTLKLRKWRWYGAGISLSYNNSWIMNNETIAGLNRSSLNNTRFSYAPEIGLTAVFSSARDYRFELEMFILSEQSQKINQYIDALYQERELLLHYHKAHLSWQMPVRIMPGKIGFGGYYALLSHAEEIISGESRMINELYSREDYGFTLQYKLEYGFFSGLVLAPSIRAQYSVKNIFNGNETIPGFFRKTHNANLGINLQIFYRF